MLHAVAEAREDALRTSLATLEAELEAALSLSAHLLKLKEEASNEIDARAADAVRLWARLRDSNDTLCHLSS